ncbi:MAG TPA: polysaccharide deacetylase family protein [Micromonosporaceae bacterium]|nr:polysaccharide deacetylase family protein [Micromonosporaceae bacterium]
MTSVFPVPHAPARSDLLRRAAVIATSTAVLAAIAVLGTPLGSADAASTKSHGHGHADNHAPHGAADSRLPAPPRPTQLRPAERVVAGGGATTRAPRSGKAPTQRASFSTASFSTADTPTAAMVTAAEVAPAPGVVPATAAKGAAAPGAGTAKTLVVYDNTGPYGWLGEAYGMQAANLVSHFGSWVAHPVGQYTANEIASFSAVIYVGSTYDEPVPVAFLDDVATTTKPVVWMYDNIWQLTARRADFATQYGYTWKGFDVSDVATVNYRGTALTRDTQNKSGIMDTVIYDPAKAKAVGTAVRPDGTTFPWAVRSGNLTYLGEMPFSYVTHDDRYLAFADMLYDVLAPAAVTRHRALVRIEDVGPDADPAELRAITDYLYSRKVPFTVAVYPRYRDPKGAYNGGIGEDYTLRQRPKVVSALKYMQSRGGTLLMHGYTHQYEAVNNPYDGASGNDFEFYAAHVDANDRVIYDGPVAKDSPAWATDRINASFREFTAAGLSAPTIFEFPHYAASVVDYKAVAAKFTTRYERGLYFPGSFSNTKPDYTRVTGQFFPYTVRDIYGTAVVPENIGNVEPDAFNTHPARLPADLIASARRNLIVRDGTASLFYHPYLGTAHLKTTIEGIQGLGYTFVPAAAMLR